MAVHFALAVDAFAVGANSIIAMTTAFAAVGNIEERVGRFAVAIRWAEACDALVIFANQALCAFVVAAAASIDGADLHFFGAAVGSAIAEFAFALNTGFAVGTTVAAGAAVVDGTGGIVVTVSTEDVADASAVGASGVRATGFATSAAVVVVLFDVDAFAAAIQVAFDFMTRNAFAAVKQIAVFAFRDGALALNAVHRFGILRFVGIAVCGAAAAMGDVRRCIDALARAIAGDVGDLKKVLSGGLGRNLIDLPFTTQQVLESGTQLLPEI